MQEFYQSNTFYYRDLKLLQERQQKKCESLESIVREDEAVFSQEVHKLQEENKVIKYA